MALNLSTLTSPATSGDVLAEALTTADFLEGVPVLRNLARGSQKGGDAKQGTALNQPKALPLDANGKGYLYLSGVSGNYASVPDATNLDGFGDFTFQVDNLYLPDWSPSAQVTPIAKGSSWQFSVHTSGSLRLDLSGVSSAFSDPTGLADKTTASIRAVRAGSVLTFFYSLNGGETWVSVPYNYGGGSGTLTNDPLPLAIGAANVSSTVLGKVSGAKVWNNATQSGTPVLDVDFTATKIRHNDTKFVCDSGQVVTINKSGNDPATIIKKPVLRFANKSDDSTNISLAGLFNQTITDGYMFAAFTVLGDGGEGNGRVFSVDNGNDNSVTGGIFSLGATNNLRSYYRGGLELDHIGLFDDALGNVLHDVKLTTGSQVSKVNNADQKTATSTGSLTCVNFNIASRHDFDKNAAIDLEYLALFPATITDDQADSVRNYINNRNNVFDLKDGFGYYFYDAQKAPVGAISSGSSSWNGRIVGSDNGDTDRYLTQGTSNDAPVGDGFKVTFADNTDHLEIPQVTQAGWQVVGTSLGTFAYRVNNTAVNEINLLGNLGSVSYRKDGDLYGVMLLPESASSADIEAAKRLLIDRGAAESYTGSNLYAAWHQRADLVEFKSISMPHVQNLGYTWSSNSLVSFPAMEFPSAQGIIATWFNNTSMSDFGVISAPNCNNFSYAWQNCSALSSFPSGAKLGTAASNVSFTSAWQSSGLTSFSTPLPTATNVNQAWYQCASLTSFSSELQTVTSANYAWSGCTSLTSFDTPLPLATQMLLTWYNCPSLTSFSSELPSAANVNQGWLNCTSLSDFSADVFANWNPSSISSGVFNNAWDGCTSLTAQSVENILTSIAASGKFATSTGASGGTALGDAAIDIDYNVATGSLSAATNAAVTSLKAKGWSIIVNNVTL
ncbi:hypothetical protein HOQ53_gp14 [uncultured phage_MedDCM-OCT-S45-C18]|uniref:Uncharacterized protein n=1 Tax=uncultured phage_MedDCM-OCT-S45-C18 TaxID=2741072 RepID=A0A6S4P7U1_9CAUD|nr:hypothetical protein HOQ53_gp14 [uncultured phage_MedDCM-OCT-S45-C18]BAQ94261.1 hypothetical protein [uncultured phage_MedDCM-OCT-S45-C18]